MPTKQHRSKALQVLACFLLLLTTTQPCGAQDTAPDSLLQSSRLYQKGKKNVRFGTTFFGIGLATALIGLTLKEEEPSAWDFAPSGKEMVYFFGAVFGTIGIIKIIQGGVRIKKAKSELGMVMYQRSPGVKAQMPALRVQWSLSEALAKKRQGYYNAFTR